MFDKTKLVPALKNIFLLTPNTKEAVFMTGIDNPLEAAKELSNYCNVLLKGGHNEAEIGVDYLFANNKIEKISPTQSTVFAKHGSGCVLSSAIASNLTLGNDLLESCRNAKNYTEKYLTSHESLLGLHYV